MKKYILILLLSIGSLSSCDYLDVDESIFQEESNVFGYFDEVKKAVTHIYAQIPGDWGEFDGALRESATDNAVHVWDASYIKNFYNGSWSEISILDSKYEHYYNAIRASNVFLETFDITVFERFEHNADYDVLMAQVKYYPWEVRFLRAFYHFELAKRYGDIALIKRSISADEVNSLSRAKFEDVINFIVEECDEISGELPVSYRDIPGKETGRITRGACMALKSRASLYAASSLHNTESVETKWEMAAKASWAVIDSALVNNWYALIPDEKLWGTGNVLLNSKQLILEKRGDNSNGFEYRNTPVGYEGGATGTCPSQNLVDAFEFKSGVKFNYDDPKHVAYPYYDEAGVPNRDPRLYKTVLNNGATWSGLKVESYVNGRNGAPINGATLTGYYIRKYMDPDVNLTAGQVTSKPHHYVIFRYAEILLNYAEAMYMWKGAAYKDAVFSLSALDAINAVRVNAGMPEVVSVDIDAIRNERRIELAFEDHRFWDIRRWKIGEVTKEIYGVNIVKESGGNLVYTKELIQNRLWEDKMYLYPIPKSERFRNPNLGQNPGW